jgi:hypothetical protein
MLNDAFAQLGIYREGDVSLLSGGVRQNFFFLCPFPMKMDGILKIFSTTSSLIGFGK